MLPPQGPSAPQEQCPLAGWALISPPVVTQAAVLAVTAAKYSQKERKVMTAHETQHHVLYKVRGTL